MICGAARRNISRCFPSRPSQGIWIPGFLWSQYFPTAALKSACRAFAKSVFVGSVFTRAAFAREGFCFCSSVLVTVPVIVSGERNAPPSRPSRSPSLFGTVTVVLLDLWRVLVVLTAACWRASKMRFASIQSSKQTEFRTLTLPFTWSNLRRIRRPWTAQSSSPNSDFSARSRGSPDSEQSSDCHWDMSKLRYPIWAVGCIALTAGEPRHLSICNGIHCCHFAAIFTRSPILHPTRALRGWQGSLGSPLLNQSGDMATGATPLPTL